MPIQPFNPHYPFTDEKLAALKQIVPEAFEDGRLNFDTLREVLQPNLDPEGTVDDDGERFGLIWPGKKEARRLAAIPSKGTLAPVYGEGLKVDGTPDDDGQNDSRNVFIEGENLEVLKIMQKAYAGRVKMIYIDPPYNTGNDFVYDDNFTEPLEHYLRRTGQIDDEGQKLTTNTKADGRFHSKWLSMMYPRLRLARNLLKEDGVIFVSIDDNEMHNLRALMNEVFGEENFMGSFLWHRRVVPDSRNNNKVSVDHEYILLYSKSNLAALKGRPIDTGKYKNPDNDPRGPWTSENLTGLANSIQRPNLHYDLINPRTGIAYPPSKERGWSKGVATMNKLIEEERILWPSASNGRPREKKFLKNLNNLFTGFSTWLNAQQVGHTTDGTRDLAKLFEAKLFDFPKPVKLLKTLINQVVQDGELILDFFAGSGTIGHAVAELETRPKYILVQLPTSAHEKSEAAKKGYDNIAQIALERLRRASAFRQTGSLGFKKFILSNSQLNFNSSLTLGDIFDQSATPKHFDCKHLIWEVIVQEGFPLDSIIRAKPISNQIIYSIDSGFHDFSLHCCFDKTIAPAVPPQLELGENDIFICFDSALDDQMKLRLSDKGLIKTI